MAWRLRFAIFVVALVFSALVGQGGFDQLVNSGSRRWRAWWNGSPTHLLPDRFEPTEFVGFWLASEYRFSRVLPSTRASFLGFSIRTPAPMTLRVGLLNRSQQIEFVVTRDITEINQWRRIGVPFGVLLAVVNSDFEGSEIRIWSDDNDVYEFDELVTV